MNKQLFIKSETELEIEVNDGFIYIDSADLELPKKIDNLYETFNKGHKELLAKEVLIKKEQDDKIKQDKMISATIDFVDSVYKAINELFGKGASKRIFRSKTIAGIETFLGALPPYLEELKIKTERYYEDRTSQEAKDKYAPRNEVEEEIEEVE